MSGTLDALGAAPEVREPRFLQLLFGCAIAPLSWLGQVMLAYGVTAYICYPADHPVTLVAAGPLPALIAFDLTALAGCGAGAWVSWRIWARLGKFAGRNRFLALWGVMSSLWFFAAILFNVIASLMVPSCPA